MAIYQNCFIVLTDKITMTVTLSRTLWMIFIVGLLWCARLARVVSHCTTEKSQRVMY